MLTQPARERPPAPAAATDEGLHDLLRSFGVSATLVRADGGIILEGSSPTYYGKQMAQEIVRKADLVVVANRIRVLRPAARADGPRPPR